MVKLIIDEAHCNGCGNGVKVCKSRSLEIRDNVCVATRPDECKLCMLCKVTCPVCHKTFTTNRQGEEVVCFDCQKGLKHKVEYRWQAVPRYTECGNAGSVVDRGN